MKIFWKDRFGHPPKNATFHCLPFFPKKSPLDLSKSVRIETLPPPTPSIPIFNQTFFPKEEEWNASVISSTKAIEEGAFQKVVLARCCTFECEITPDPFAITAALQKKAPGATLFCFANEEMAFLGASPEFLFIRNQTSLFTEAVAGTTRRGENLKEDEALEKELLLNPKTNREIVPVQTFLKEKLSPLCITPPSFSQISVKKTPNVQHLCSQATATLKKGVSDEEILKQIHPTPALAGLPQESALKWILRNERFDRKFYGGAIGWQTDAMSVWAVAIRCCFIEGKKVSLYTGVGLVEGSNPKEEWEELNMKMNLYRGIFL